MLPPYHIRHTWGVPEVAGKLTPMKDRYTELAEKYGPQLVVNGQVIRVRDAQALMGLGNTVTKEFLRRYLAEHHPDLAQARKSKTWVPASLTAAEVPEEEADAPEEAVEPDGKTWTDDRSGTVFTDLGPDYGVMVLTKGEFRAIRRDYSKHYGGGSTTQTELSIRYRFPSANAFEVFRRIHGIRQNSLPFMDEEIEEEGVDVLVGKAIESKRQAFFLKLQDEERKAEKRDAEKWRAFEINANLIASQVASKATDTQPMFVPQGEASPYALLLNVQDIHYGKLAYNAAGERVYDRRTAAYRTREAVRDLLAQAMMVGRPEEIILVVGGDYLTHDSLASTTTRGTPQGPQSDGDYREILTEGAALMIELVKTARTLAPVRLLFVPGNHDAQSTLFLSLLLKQAFLGDARVATVDQNDGTVFVNYGESSILVAHGENLKEKDVFRVMVAAAEEQNLPLKRAKLAFVGHVHHERQVDLGGIKLHTCPSLSEPDQWHRQNHYSGSIVEAQAFMIRRKGGKGMVFYSDPDLLKAQ